MSGQTDPELAMDQTRAVLEAGCRQGWHLGAQLSVHVRGVGGGHLSVGERRPGEPMTDDTLLRWWSAGKPRTALAVAQQVERGALVLDHPVAHWIPEFAAAGKERVSIRHLLTHSSGMRMAEALPEGLGEQEILAWICALPLEEGVAAGEGAAYDPQAAWQVLAELVTRGGGRPFADLVRSGILEPLGM
ncbi:MAG: beta-lactamase family protein, partial [Verrucomicrobiales bacterium]|nr:beta-lactamase family protein [Verrucomicrobiales bacterium]